MKLWKNQEYEFIDFCAKNAAIIIMSPTLWSFSHFWWFKGGGGRFALLRTMKNRVNKFLTESGYQKQCNCLYFFNTTFYALLLIIYGKDILNTYQGSHWGGRGGHWGGGEGGLPPPSPKSAVSPPHQIGVGGEKFGRRRRRRLKVGVTSLQKTLVFINPAMPLT